MVCFMGMSLLRLLFITALTFSSEVAESSPSPREERVGERRPFLPNSDVHLIGEMRRMFTERDIRPNVDLAKVNTNAHLYALGPVAGLKGEITVSDGQVFVSTATHAEPSVTLQSKVKAVFLVYASVPAWRSILIP